jgi:hypothetical protein
MAKSFYPNLSSIVTVDQFPEQLQFVENRLQQVLEKIYYKNLQYVRNSDGTGGYYMSNEIHYRVSYLRKKPPIKFLMVISMLVFMILIQMVGQQLYVSV